MPLRQTDRQEWLVDRSQVDVVPVSICHLKGGWLGWKHRSRRVKAKAHQIYRIDDQVVAILRRMLSNVTLHGYGFPESNRPAVDPDPDEGSA